MGEVYSGKPELVSIKNSICPFLNKKRNFELGPLELLDLSW